ncbi:MAG TPA: prepilin-type N-terminal cleavage/methylation domain-containing protein [Burkholderiales bacterium]|nr:prepilin-type N-terminal cleavage/methylation domain-containing protein [Burkholderiales bacterium]
MKLNKKGQAESGFTLVEIAIVLVIIGLLLGGILKGQEMITQAKIKNIINDFNGVTAAVNSYQDRYRAMPGDDATAATRWTTQGAVAGNGDGILGVGAGTTCTYNAVVTGVPAAAAECNLFWWHLRLAGFVPGAVVGAGVGIQPPNAVNGIIGVQQGGMGFTSNIVCSSNLPDKIAIAVDTQMDDGTPAAGEIRGSLQAAPNPAVPAGSTIAAYSETGTNQYLLCKNL